MTTAMTEQWKGMQKAGHWLLITPRFLNCANRYLSPSHAEKLQTTVATLSKRRHPLRWQKEETQERN